MNSGGNLQEYYDNQYDDSMDAWRDIVSHHKVERLRSLIKGEKNLKIVDWGAGEGSLLEILDKAQEVSELHALEISDTGLQKTRDRKLKKLKGVQKFDGYKTKYKDNEFDIAICFHVMEHVEFPRLLLREIRRISKRQIFEIPLDYAFNVDQKTDHLFSYGHLNVFSPATFRFLLTTEGLKVEDHVFEGIPLEIKRFQEYSIWGNKKTILSELRVLIKFAVQKTLRFLMGKTLSREYLYESYTCLTSKVGSGPVKIGEK